MRIAIVVYWNGALSVPCGWGQPARGVSWTALLWARAWSHGGLREAPLGLLGQRSGLFYFQAGCQSSVSRNTSCSAQEWEFAGVDTRREPLVARKDAQC